MKDYNHRRDGKQSKDDKGQHVIDSQYQKAFKKEYEKNLDAKLLEKEDEKKSTKKKDTPPINYQIDDIKKWLFNIKEVGPLCVAATIS